MKSVAIVLSLIAGLAQAQEPTVEGAQKFIAGIAEEGGITVTLDYNEVKKSLLVSETGDTEMVSKTFPPDKVSRTEATSACSTKFYVDLSTPTVISHMYARWGLDERGRSIGKYYSENFYHPQSNEGTKTSFVHSIDWAKVPTVKKNHDMSISVVDGDGNHNAKFFVKSEDYATRLNYAMEFLRIKCDKKSATGF